MHVYDDMWVSHGEKLTKRLKVSGGNERMWARMRGCWSGDELTTLNRAQEMHVWIADDDTTMVSMPFVTFHMLGGLLATHISAVWCQLDYVVRGRLARHNGKAQEDLGHYLLTQSQHYWQFLPCLYNQCMCISCSMVCFTANTLYYQGHIASSTGLGVLHLC
jgi:hypothetical protein